MYIELSVAIRSNMFNIKPFVFFAVNKKEQGRVVDISERFHHKGSADGERGRKVVLPKRGMSVHTIGVRFPVIVLGEVKHFH